jgi:hypothetical protein
MWRLQCNFFLEDGVRKLQLALLMQSYNIFHPVEFPTRVGKNTSTAIDNIFIDRARICGNIPTNAKRPFPRGTAVVGLPATATSSSRQPIPDGQPSDGQV